MKLTPEVQHRGDAQCSLRAEERGACRQGHQLSQYRCQGRAERVEHRCPENLVGGPMGGQGPHAGQADSPCERFAEPLAWEGMPLLGVGPPRARRGRASEMRPVAEQAVKQAALWG